MIPYSIVFSKRKTLSLQVKADGTVTVRAPVGTKQKIIEDFVDKNSAWLEKTKKKMLSKQELFREASSEEEKDTYCINKRKNNGDHKRECCHFERILCDKVLHCHNYDKCKTGENRASVHRSHSVAEFCRIGFGNAHLSAC